MTAPVFALEPETLACPFPEYGRWREAPPFYEDAIGAWVVSRYEDVREVLRSPERFSSRYPTGPRLAEMVRAAVADAVAADDGAASALVAIQKGRWTGVLHTSDPPLHERQRTLVNRAFTPRQVGAAEHQVVEVCHRLIDGFVADGHVELVGQFGWPLPLEVIARRLGLPLTDMPHFRRWSIDISAGVGNHAHSRDAAVRQLVSQGEFCSYFLARIAEKRAEPANDVLSMIVTATLPDGDHLADDEMLGMLAQILVAGHETTTNLVCMSVLRLLQTPGLADRLRADPARISTFVEETLRLESPSQGMFRMAREDTEVAGQAVAKGEHVYLVFAAANRDPDAFTCPADVDMERRPVPPHLGFGHGIHFCLGAPLARQEARVALTALLGRLDGLQLAPDAAVAYNDSYLLRGLRRLDLTFRPR